MASSLVAQALHQRASGLAPKSLRSVIPRTLPPTRIEEDYAQRLVDIVDRIRELTQPLLDSLPSILRTDSARADASGADARRAMAGVRAAIDSSLDVAALERTAGQFAERVSTHQKGNLERQVKAALGIEGVITPDAKLRGIVDGFVHENVSLITKLKGRVLDDIEGVVTRAVTSGSTADAVAKEIQARFGVEERHARLIARDQIGKVHGQIARARHQELGLKRYRWITKRDERVRPRHRVRHGKIYTYEGEGQAPTRCGEEVGCRCVEEPIFTDLITEVKAEERAAVQASPGLRGAMIPGVPRGPRPRIPSAAPLPVTTPAPTGFQIGVTPTGTGRVGVVQPATIAPAPPTARPLDLPMAPPPIPAPIVAPKIPHLEDPFRSPGAVKPRTVPSSKPAPVGFEALEHDGELFFQHKITGRSYTPEQQALKEAGGRTGRAFELRGPNEQLPGFKTWEVDGELQFRGPSQQGYTRAQVQSGEAADTEKWIMEHDAQEAKRPGFLMRVLNRLGIR